MNRIDKLVLGTAQFGQPYGINNLTGMPSREDALALLEFAHDQGIRLLDTALVYGTAHELIRQFHQQSGKAFRVYTKFHGKDSESLSQPDALNKSLATETLEGLFFHRFNEYLKASSNHPVFQIRAAGLAQRIGVSIYNDDELEILVSDDRISLIQVPFNLLDHSPERIQLLQQAKENGKRIQCRSVFLQGLFFKNPNDLPAHLADLSGPLKELEQIARNSDRSMADIALNYCLTRPYLDEVLIGTETIEQLKLNLEAVNRSWNEDIATAVEAITVERQESLNPALWNQ
jgi:aryl-alcohol dehydrogenase-like predicted oxidoreductase